MVALNDKKMLVLQGGGALGAYQAGAYEALHQEGIRPEWISGISIGAINSALIAGSAPEQRVANLRSFWEKVTSGPSALPLGEEPLMRRWFNEFSSAYAASVGVPGFYMPRTTLPFGFTAGQGSSISLYDTSPLINTLNDLVDFDLINKGPVRLSVGAVNVETANFRYFDSDAPEGPVKISAKHIAASGALPPGFPPVEIDGEFYWDGGLVSNTPLNWIMEQRSAAEDICVFQVDVFSAKGHMPIDLGDVAAREKEIRFSSRTRLITNMVANEEKNRNALKRLLDKIRPELHNDPDVQQLKQLYDNGGTTVVHLIYQRRKYETSSMDNEFSRVTMEDHWRAGFDDVMRTLNCQEWQQREIPEEGFKTIDWQRSNQEGPENEN